MFRFFCLFLTFFFSPLLCTTEISIDTGICPCVFHSDLDVTQVAVYLSTDVLSYPQKWTCFNCGILRSASYCTRMLWDKESFKSQICSWTGILSVQIQAWIILFNTMLCGDVCAPVHWSTASMKPPCMISMYKNFTKLFYSLIQGGLQQCSQVSY